MVVIEKEDILKIKVLNDLDKTICFNCDKYSAIVDYNNKHYTVYGYQVNDKSASDMVKDLYIKVNALYKVINRDNKEVYFNEILLTVAELIFRIRIDLGVNQ